MKTTAPKTDWTAVAQKMAADKKRIAAAIALGAALPDDIQLAQHAALPTDSK